MLRHITSNIRRVTSVKQDDRSFIVRCISTLTSEGVPFRVYKFDIRSFYESVDVQTILNRLSADIAFSGQSVRALTSFFAQLAAAGIVGLPRGLSLSATLAEYLMRGFDQEISGWGGVWYYARFVDDILVITDGREDSTSFPRLATLALPKGLQFNQKSKSFDFMPFVRGNTGTVENTFDFLGYEFGVTRAFRNSSNRIGREVRIDLASSKVRKLKTRVARSLHAFRKDGDFLDLRDRLRMLTANVVYVDIKTGVRRPSGIYFNYPLIDSTTSNSLRGLDQFTRRALTGPHPRNKLYPTALTATERRELAGLTFADGFADRRFFHIPTKRLIDLSTVWAYV